MVAACGGDDPTIQQPSQPSTTDSAATTTVAGANETATAITISATTVLDVPADLEAFGLATVTVGDEEWLVAVADTPEERFDGLRGITELGDADGMIFVYEDAETRSFTMRDVTQPLEIGFFDGDGVLIDTQKMVPCLEDECPTYVSPMPARWAIETFPGGILDLPLGTRLVVS